MKSRAKRRGVQRGGLGHLWIAVVVVALTVVMRAQWSLEWQGSSIGGAVGGGSYQLTGGPDVPAPGVSAGGGYELTGGFWGPMTALQAPAPVLMVERLGGRMLLSWPSASGAFELERARGLPAGGTWERVEHATNVIGGRVVVPVEADGESSFYRLRRP